MAKIQAKKTKSKASPAKKKLVKAPQKTPKVTAGRMPKKGPLVVKEAFNNSLLMKTLVERSQVAKKDVLSVLEGLKEIMVAHLVKKGPQKFKWQGFLMMKIRDKPATKARKGINPFNGEEMIFAAKPARRMVKITALKKLKEAI